MRAESYDLDDLKVSAISWEIRDAQTERITSAAASADHPAVKKILYHPAASSTDAHYVDIYMETGVVQRIFNPTQVVFNHEASSDDTERADGCEDQTEANSGSCSGGSATEKD